MGKAGIGDHDLFLHFLISPWKRDDFVFGFVFQAVAEVVQGVSGQAGDGQ